MKMSQQAIHKLHVQIVEHTKKNGTITNNSKICPGLEQLFEELNGAKSHLVTKILLKLIWDKQIQVSYLVTTCVSKTAYGKNLEEIIKLVVKVISNKGSDYQYSSEPSKHPLSRIFTNQPGSLQLILSMIHEELFKFVDLSSVAQSKRSMKVLFHAVLYPFTEFVFKHGNHVNEVIAESLDMMNLLNMFDLQEQITEMAINLKTLFMNIETMQKSSHDLVTGLQKLVKWCLSKDNILERVGWDLICLLLTVSWHDLESGQQQKLYHSIFLMKHLMMKLLPLKPEKQHCSHVIEKCVFICAMILIKVDDNSVIYQILQIVLLFLNPKSTDVLCSKPAMMTLVLPLLQTLSQKIISEEDHNVHALADNIMRNIDVTLDGKFNGKCKLRYSKVFNIAHCSLFTVQTLRRNTKLVLTWLQGLKEMKIITENNILILSSLFLLNETSLYKDLMNSVANVVRMNNRVIDLFFPFLMFIMGSKRFKESKLSILHGLPCLAVSKESLPVVLNTILSLSKNTELLPISLHLMTEVWKQQPRIYSYVHQLLSKDLDKTRTPLMLWLDWMLARVASIVKICHSNASQYGQDMVVILSDILEVSIKDDLIDITVYRKQMSSSLALLLEALKSVCKALVIDIESIWKAIIMKLQTKQDSLILQSICSLLDCIPTCVSSSKEVFLDEVLTYLWFLITYQDCAVQTAAFKALSKFPIALMKVKYLPKKIQQAVSDRLRSSKEHKDEEDYQPDDDIIPGYGFVMLLHEIPEQTYQGYQVFMTSMLQQELETLPRGVGRRLQMKPTTSVTDDIAGVLKNQYETNTAPGILPGLSAGLLFCYEPSVSGMDTDNPSNKHLVQYKDRYCQTLQNLLQDFSVQQNDWHHMIFVTHSWGNFMKKLFVACLEGRKADIEIQNENGLFEDKESYEEELYSVKPWVRDDITSKLRKASKGNPKVQGNSIFALVGLASAVETYEEGEEKMVAEQYISTRHWLLTVADTVMVVFDGNYKSKHKPFQWCQQLSSTKSTASSLLSRCAAALAFNELVSPLLAIDTERIVTMVTMLKDRLPGQSKAVSSTALQLHISLGYGLLLSMLYKEKFEDIVGEGNDKQLTTSAHKMKEIVVNNDIENKDGLIVGYGLTISSILAFDTNKDSQIFAANAHKELANLMESTTKEELSTLTTQAQLFSFSLITMYAYQAEHLTLEEVEKYFEMIEKNVCNNQFSDLYAALGSLSHVMLKSKSKHLTEKVEKKLEAWKSIIHGKNESTMNKLCALKGVISTYGIETVLFDGVINDTILSNQLLRSILKLVVKYFGAVSDNFLLNLTSRLLGTLCNFTSSTSGTYSNVPTNYDYLKENMLLPVMYSSLIEASASGVYGKYKESKLLCILNSFIDITDVGFPPVNWTNVLAPLFRVGYSENLKILCVKFAVKYVSNSKSLVLLTSSWLQPTVFARLEKNIQLFLIQEGSLLMSLLSNTKQKCLLSELPNILLKDNQTSEGIKCVFEAWLSALKMKVPIQSAVAYVLGGLKVFFNNVSSYSMERLEESIPLFAECVRIILNENWRNILDELDNEILQQRFEVEILKLLPSVKVEEVLNLMERINKVCLPNLVQIIAPQQQNKLSNFVTALLTVLGTRYSQGKILTETEMTVFYTCLSCLSTQQYLVSKFDVLQNNDIFQLQSNIQMWSSMLMLDDSQRKTKIGEAALSLDQLR